MKIGNIIFINEGENQTKSSQSTPIEQAMKWYIPKVNPRGAEFVTGANQLRETQKDTLENIRMNLWG